MTKKRIAILGSTGSIGRQALEVVAAHPDKLEVVGLAAGRNTELFQKQLARWRPKVAAMAAEDAVQDLVWSGDKCPVYAGTEGLVRVATWPDVDMVLVAVTGTAGLVPVIEAIKAGKEIALANKETMVVAGEVVTAVARKHGIPIIPVDSEHSAVWQCMNGRGSEVRKIILTASGGPFRAWSSDELSKVTPEAALCHPTWQMGAKITIDSATLMNKGLEVIEARWLFETGYDSIEVVIHPQSIIHGMAELADGTIIACLSSTDMRLPIQYAFSYPERWESQVKKLNFEVLKELTFEAPDTSRFPCLKLAYRAGLEGGTAPCVLNAANEVAVEAFLKYQLSFTDIPVVVETVLDAHVNVTRPNLEAILAADEWARRTARNVIKRVSS
ncbi:MAG: 1-deoxy-D-xylulose-5-phosphate reductoisomerase [Peptococcaceae bacterium]|nr:1-deoxy-D-xylulose-5-phosphate reductoisomerase [Peptococcaceae bacterium]